MTEKTAVVLLNLGGPDRASAIKPFLFNFFMDKNIIDLALPFRFILAKWISLTRGVGEAHTAYAQLGGKSPILKNTHAQVTALYNHLKERGHGDIDVFVSMRYWHPRADAVLKEIKKRGYTQVLLLPLYPQFSTTTSFSSMEEWQNQAKKLDIKIVTQRTCCYPLMDGFIKASAQKIQKIYDASPQPVRILFSAHGLPQKMIDGGDPYQWQCEETAKAIAKELNAHEKSQGDHIDWQICYQSRVGRLAWIGPSTDEALEKAAEDNIGVIIYPHAFVSEHVETLVEIDIDYRARARNLGIPSFAKVDTVGTDPLFIHGLADIVETMLKGEVSPATRICPQKYSRCGHGLYQSNTCK